MDMIGRLLHRASFTLAVISGLAVFATMLIVCVDVLLRFNHSGLPGTTEIVSYYLMLSVGFLPLALVERVDGMITVDAVYAMLGTAFQRAIRIFAMLFSVAVYAALVWATFNEAMKNFRSGAYYDTSAYLLVLWPAYFIVPFSIALALLVAIHRTVDLMRGGPLEPLSPDPVPDAPHGEGAAPDYPTGER